MKALKTAIACLIFTALPAIGNTAAITVGETFPQIMISDLGECVLKGDETDFEPWDSGKLRGEVQVVEYVAARAGIDEIHRKFFDALAAQSFTGEKVKVTKLVNSDDALWGTSGLVPGEIRKNKKQEPEQVLVVDAEGLGQKQWGLTRKSAAIAILDSAGTVLFFKEGDMTADEIENSIQLIKDSLR